MELLGDVGHVEYCFGPFGGGTSIGARYVHGLHQTYHSLRYHFGHTQWYSKGDDGLVEARFDPFGDSANVDAR